MSNKTTLISDLKILNQIVQTLNRAVDVRTALESSLEQLVQLMGLETGWIFIHEPAAFERWAGRGFQLAAHYQLPPALDLLSKDAWDKGCSCQNHYDKGSLDEAYNEIRCSRLAESKGDRHGLSVHASSPLQSGSRVLGILNIAAKDWASFDERTLAMLTTVGAQIGIALERARLHDMLRKQRIQEQSALLTFSQKLLRGSSLESLEMFIVDEARRLLDVDASALLLPDGNDPQQLYFPAATGWRTDPVGLNRRIPADEESQVGRVMVSQKSLVSDVPKNLPVTAFDRWAATEEFKVFAAVPLVVDEDSIGILVIHSRQDRNFTEIDLRFLQLLANQAAIALEAARLQIEQLERQRMERELAVGRQIQRSMVPEECPLIPGWQFATAFEAAREVGGDFYDFFPFAQNSGLWGTVIADVSDKGVPAALYMVLSRTTIRNTARPDRDPSQVLQLTNRYIHEDSQADMFLSAFYATLDTENGRLTYSNAGHNYPLWWRAASRQIEELSEHGTLVGVLDDLWLDNHVIDLAEDDLLVLYTDGVTDAINSEEHDFGTQRLKNVVSTALASSKNLDAQDMIDVILDAVKAYTGDQPQFDDMTLFVIKRVRVGNAG
jgi:sigma-B regulation protein RsbU (phosphoserine phosphatase)